MNTGNKFEAKKSPNNICKYFLGARINSCAILLIAAASIATTGCKPSNPYEQKLPIGADLTVEKIQKIADSIPNPDKTLLLKWFHRQNTGDTFPDEGIANNITTAIENQLKHEKKLKEIAEAKLKKEKENEELLKKIKDAQEQNKKEIALHELINKYINIKVGTYNLVPLYNARGEQYASAFRFDMNVRNNGLGNVIGFSGTVTIHDIFDKTIGSYPVRIESKIKAQSTELVYAYLPYNDQDPAHAAMRNFKSIKPYFVFDNLAFENGSTVNINNFSDPSHFDDKGNPYKQ